VSDSSQGDGWWIASDGKWYPPDQVPGPVTPPAPVEAAPVEAAPTAPPTAPPTEPTPVTPPAAAPAPAAAPLPTPPPAPGYAAPPPAPGYVAPPPTSGEPAPVKKSGNGCLKAFLIVFAIMVVLGIGLFVLLAFVVKKGVDTVNNDVAAQAKVEKRTGISSLALGFNSKHPPQDDISTDFSCTTDSSGNMQASGQLTNHSSDTSTYTISVSFRQNGSEVGTGSDLLPSVDAGQNATWTATSFTPAEGSFTCKITEVERFNVNTFISTTTTR
jgi:hypothetical protein